ncbi:MAG: right-handed parallel beta-helix repeat-containing protein, partial [Acidimicrobiia bacterium]
MRTENAGRRRAASAVAVLLIVGLLPLLGPDAAVAAPTRVDIRDFGATANDASDDTAAIQAAIDAARWGGTVTIPSGVFRVSPQRSSAALSLRTGVTIEGAGPASVLKVVDGNGRRVHVLSTRSAESAPPRNVVLRNFAIDGNRLTSTQSPSHEHDHGIYVTPSSDGLPSHILIEGVTVTGVQGDGVLVHGGEQITLRNNHVHNNYRGGLNLEGASNSTASGNLASENKSGIHVEMNPGVVNRGLVIVDNTLINNNCGICLNGNQGTLEDVTVKNNLIVGPTNPSNIGDGTQLGATVKYGIGLSNLNGATVSGNVLREWTEEGGIKVRWGVRNAVIDHNTIVGTRGPAGNARGMIRVGGSTNSTPNSNIVVTNNLLHETRGGLYLTTNSGSRSSNITFEANTVDGLLAGQPIRIRDAGGTVRITRNTLTHASGWDGSYLINVNAEAGAGGLD